MRNAVSFIALLAVVALSILAMFSLMGPGTQPEGLARQVPRLSPGVFRILVVLVCAALVVSLGVLVADVVRNRHRLFSRESGRHADHSFLVLFLTVVATLAVFIFVLAFGLSLLPMPEDLEGAGLQPIEELDEETEEEQLEGPLEEQIELMPQTDIQSDRRDLTRQILSVLGVAAAVVAAILAYRYMKSVRKANILEDEESFRELREDLARSAMIGLDRILAEPDHRMAIIAAYAHMEATFRNHGFPQRESQTPTEYMEETLSRIEATLRRRSGRVALPRRQLLTLTRLYEIAKFSLHELTVRDRQSALDSLREVENSAPAVADAGERR